MHKFYKFWKVHFFTCDGGINPSHHHPINVQIHENQDGTCDLWKGSARQETYANYDAALEYLCIVYDRVSSDGYNLITNFKPKEPKIIQWK